jgi:hypothetical protein
MESLLNFLVSTNWQTIIAMFALGWYFTSDLRREMKEMRQEMKQQNTRIDQLYQMFVDSQKEFNQKFYDLLKERK